MPTTTSDPYDTTCAKGAIVSRPDPETVYAFPARCRRWSCAYCRPKRSRQLRRRLALVQANLLLTLTIRHHDGTNPQHEFERLQGAFRLLIKRLRRRTPRTPIRYVRILETTAAGAPHLHVMMRAPYIPQHYVSAVMLELADSPIVDVRRITSKRKTAHYLTNYLTKSWHGLPGRRVWSASPGFLPPEPPREPEPDEVILSWAYTGTSYETVVRRALAAGHLVIDASWQVAAPL